MKLRIYTRKDNGLSLYFSYPKMFAESRKSEAGPVIGIVIDCADDENLVPTAWREWKQSDGSPSRKIGSATPQGMVPEGLVRQAGEFEALFRDAVKKGDLDAITNELTRLASQPRKIRRERIVRVNNMPMSSKTAVRTLKIIGAFADGKPISKLSDKAAEKKLLSAKWTAHDGTVITVTE